MKVVILCGGQGTRLREETQIKPKPMVEIGGKPILWHIMKIYSQYGFNDFVLCVGYKGEVIKQYFLNYEGMNCDFTVSLGRDRRIDYHRNGREESWRVTIADTGEQSLKGARLLRARPYLNEERFLMTYGDGVADVNIPELIRAHESSGKPATFTGVRMPSRFGVVGLNDRQEVISWGEKKQLDQFINGGFFVFEPEIFKYLDDQSELEGRPLETLAQERKLNIYRHFGFWACMDTYRDLVYLNELWIRGRAPWRIWGSD